MRAQRGVIDSIRNNVREVAISDLQRNPVYETVTSLTLVAQASDWRAQPPMDGFAFRRCSHQIEVSFLKENLMVPESRPPISWSSGAKRLRRYDYFDQDQDCPRRGPHPRYCFGGSGGRPD
jgi:hypothetical protein